MIRLAFVDLDGSFIAGNSFHKWLKFLALAPASPLPPLARARVLMLAGLRLVRLVSHARLKRDVLRLVARADADAMVEADAAFAAALAGDIRAPALALVQRLRQHGVHLVLATAAPENYAKPFAARNGFDHCLATPAQMDEGWVEMLHARKAAACTAYRDTRGIDRAQTLAVTDHRDDLPLMAACGVAVWCGAEPELAAVRALLGPLAPPLLPLSAAARDADGLMGAGA